MPQRFSVVVPLQLSNRHRRDCPLLFPLVNARKLVPLLLVIAGLLAWQNCFTAPFVFDDTSSILENYSIRHLWPLWQPLSPPHGIGLTVEGRPVVNFTFALNYAVSGVTPWGYHALNLAIHILAGLTLLGFALRTLLRPALSGAIWSRATSLALAIAGIWTLHPLQTEAVTYVAQRSESLMGLFYLLTLYCFIRGVDSPKPGRWYALSVTACLLGMGCKEVMVSAPLVVLLYDRMFVAGSFRDAWKRRWRLYAGLAGTWVLLGYLVANSEHPGGHRWLRGRHRLVGVRVDAVPGCRALSETVGVALPAHIRLRDSARSGTRCRPCPMRWFWQPWQQEPSSRCGADAPSAFWASGSSRFWPRVPAWCPWPLQTMAEHRMYLPLAAVVALAVMGGYASFGRRSLPVFVVLALALDRVSTRLATTFGR